MYDRYKKVDPVGVGVSAGMTLIFLIVIFFALRIFQEHFEYCKEVEISTDKVEQAITVKALVNKVEVVKYGLFGVGVGVGIGAPQIECRSSEQFLSLVPEGERIYVETQHMDTYTVRKRHLAFLKDRAGILIYDARYQYSEQVGEEKIWFPITSYTDTTVVFKATEIVSADMCKIFQEKGWQKKEGMSTR